MSEKAIQKYQPEGEGNKKLIRKPKNLFEFAELINDLDGGEGIRAKEQAEIDYAENWDGQGFPPMVHLEPFSDEILIKAGLMIEGTAKDVVDKSKPKKRRRK